MYITTRDWLNYINKLSAIDKKTAELMQRWIQLNGFGDKNALIDYAYGLATKYGEASGALAAAMYDAISEVEGKFYDPAEPAPTPEYNEVAKTVNGTLKHSQNPNSVSNAISRLVKRTGADTMLKNAERDGAQFAWVPYGDTCPFCLTLASRGWQYMSKKALKNGHAEHIHGNCDCTYAVRHSSDFNVEGYDPDKYLEMYENASDGSWQDKVNAMRREAYAKNKDRINSQKRIAYAKRIEATKDNNKTAGGNRDERLRNMQREYHNRDHHIDFYVGPNRKALEAKYSKWIGDSKRDEYLSIGQNKMYLNAIDQLYRPGSFIGDGGTASAILFEKETGICLGRRHGSHIQKAEGMIKYINNKVLKQNLIQEERTVTEKVRDDLIRSIQAK